MTGVARGVEVSFDVAARPPGRADRFLIYMETIGDAKAFLSAAREVALTKPILMIKAGRTEAAARAARADGKPVLASWMGGPAILAGEAILNRAGILPENRKMQRLCERLGFRLHRDLDAPLVEAEVELQPQRAAA